MLETALSPWPSFSNEEAEAVKAVLLSNKVNYWTGNEGKQFEQEFAEYTECNHAIAVANGTVALELALHGLRIGKGDEVIVTPRTFFASASAIVMCGAIPVFTEIDEDSQNITAQTIKAVITPNTKAVIAVHLAGWPCDMDSIMELANEYGVKVIEDCAQAHGARYKGRSVGALGHVAAWSFCQDKIMTTGGEGGMVTTNNEVLWKKMWAFKDHGKSYDAVYYKQHPLGFRWLHESFGTNWRLTEMQSAIGRIQIKRMSKWHNRRLRYANIIWRATQDLSCFRVPDIPAYIEHAAYKCYVFVRSSSLKPDWNRDRILEAVNDKGVVCFSGSCSEIYLEKAFDGTSMRPDNNFAIARELGESSLMFQVHPTLSCSEIERACEVLKGVARKASRL